MVEEVVAGERVDSVVVPAAVGVGDGHELAVRRGRGESKGVAEEVVGCRRDHGGNDEEVEHRPGRPVTGAVQGRRVQQGLDERIAVGVSHGPSFRERAGAALMRL